MWREQKNNTRTQREQENNTCTQREQENNTRTQREEENNTRTHSDSAVQKFNDFDYIIRVFLRSGRKVQRRDTKIQMFRKSKEVSRFY